MIDIIKKTLLAGVGAAVITKDKVEAALEDFVKQGKVSSAEARAMADKIAADGRREFEAFSNDINNRIREFLARQDRSTQDRLAALEARVTALEVSAQAEKSATPPDA